MARPPGRPGDLLTGIELHRAGRLDRAEALYSKVLAKSPNDPDALNLLGTLALARGRTARAIQLIEKSVANKPAFAAAHSNLGNAYRAAGRMVDAADSYRQAITLSPGFAEAHSNLAQVMADLGDLTQALASSQQAVTLAPALPQPHRIMANALRHLGRGTEALQAYRKARLLLPEDPALLDEFGECLAENRHFEEAVACHQRALTLNPNGISSLLAFGGTLRRAGDIPGSVGLYRRALAIDPKHAEAWTNLGHGLRALGRFEDAIQSFNRAIAIDPDKADAYRGLSLIRQQDVDADEIGRLETIRLDPKIATTDRVAAGFALGKSLDDLDRYDEAFARYNEANALYRQILASAGKSFDTGAFTALVDRLISRFDAGFFAAHAGWGDPSEVPVFVLGMPRSGTSLIEQIAASHPLVHGAGELSDIGQIETQFGNHDWSQSDVVRLANAHRASLEKRGGAAIRVIDKMPDNILKLGVIGTLFPNARVIFCTRDPRDTGLSCFFQFFPHGNPYSYDLEQTGQRHVQIDRLAAHWRATLPLRMMEANYESLVHDPERQSRAIIDFLGLPWDPACLNFHLTDRVVQTASAWQVRQPLYDRAIGRWRRYRRHLGPLIAGLEGLIAEQDRPKSPIGATAIPAAKD